MMRWGSVLTALLRHCFSDALQLPKRVRAEPGRQTHVCAIHSRKAACLLKVLPTVTGKLFLIFCLALGALHSEFPGLCPSCPPHRYAVAFRTIGGRSEASTYSEAYSERLEPLIIVAAIVCGCCISLVLYSMVYGCDFHGPFVLCTVADNSTEHLPYSHPHPHPSLFFCPIDEQLMEFNVVNGIFKDCSQFRNWTDLQFPNCQQLRNWLSTNRPSFAATRSSGPIHSVKWRHRVHGHDTNAILWV